MIGTLPPNTVEVDSTHLVLNADSARIERIKASHLQTVLLLTCVFEYVHLTANNPINRTLMLVASLYPDRLHGAEEYLSKLSMIEFEELASGGKLDNTPESVLYLLETFRSTIGE